MSSRARHQRTTSSILGKRSRNVVEDSRESLSKALSTPRKSRTRSTKNRENESPSQLLTPRASPEASQKYVASQKEADSPSRTPLSTKQNFAGIANSVAKRSPNLGQESPITPVTPSTPTIYTGAKSLFQRGSPAPGKLLCRDSEREELRTFLHNHLRKSIPGSLYISGPPGTGKSALVKEVLEDINSEYKNRIKTVSVNCMAIKKPSFVFRSIWSEFLWEEEMNDKLSDEDVLIEVEEFFRRKDFKATIVVLDEMDYLITRDQDVLYKIFDWTKMKDSNLIVIGIANALDLSSKFLPKLKARNFNQQHLRFKPYSAEQISKIISDRMESYSRTIESTVQSQAASLIHSAAIQLCARKTAANTGDLRKAFDICKRGLDLAEEDARKRFGTLEAMDNESTPSSGRTITALEIPLNVPVPKVTISHVARICSAAFGGSAVNRVQGLNLQQKAVLCALVVRSKSKTGGLTIKELYEHYGHLCAKDRLLDPLSNSEFHEVINALEACGAVSLAASNGKQVLKSLNNERRISSTVQEIDLLRAIEDVGMLKRFFTSE
ncbi:P-loop containing nucleoside triphosphate hydrolase protein [Dipodascopsis uninucleata]